MESPREGSGKSQAKRVGAFFSNLTASSLDDFSVMEYPSSYSANVVLFTEGEPVRALFVILEGEVRLSINLQRRQTLKPARCKKGRHRRPVGVTFWFPLQHDSRNAVRLKHCPHRTK